MFLLKNRRIKLRDIIGMVLQRSDFGYKGSIGNNLENNSYNFSREKIRVWPTNSTTIHRHAKKDVFPKLYEQVCVGEKTRMLSMITQIIEGQGLYFSS